MRVSVPLCALLCVVYLASAPAAQPIRLDDCESLDGWEAIHSHGDASKITIASDEGKTGRALRIDFSFLGFMGSVSVQKRFPVMLPANYRLAFDIRGEAPVNNLVVRLKDSIDNVWWVNRTSFDIPAAWTPVGIRKDQIQYGWGPTLGASLHRLDRIEIMIDVVEGGTGSVWIDNLRIEPIDEHAGAAPRVTASSSRRGSAPHPGREGRSVEGWHSAADGVQWVAVDFGGPHVLGGLVIDWDRNDFPLAFDVELSPDRHSWRVAYAVTDAAGMRSFVALPDGEGRYMRVTLKQSSRNRGYGLARMEFKGSEFSLSPNEFMAAVAGYSPSGYYPRYFSNRQSYWTVVGVPHDDREALINEEGMIETDKLSFSIDPLLYMRDSLFTWNDVGRSQRLDRGYLPVPSVRWERTGLPELTVTALAAGSAGRSVLYAQYMLVNRSATPMRGSLFLAVRPFQVNPPWQTFTIVGGVARIDSIVCGETVGVNNRMLIPLTVPDGAGAAAFDQGHITEYLRRGVLPPARRVVDPSGRASAALRFDFVLDAGDSTAKIVAVPFHAVPENLQPGHPHPDAAETFRDARNEVTGAWEERVNRVGLRLPAAAGPLAATIRSNLAYILINGDSAATQPGSRSYERSWLRDGALTSAAFLQMGMAEDVRAYLDWYATFQYPDGKIPAVVERRGPEPTPENDSNGEYIFAILQYFRFTGDTVWLRGKWNSVEKTVRYIQSLRAQRKTERYRSGSPVDRACYGLVPASISHEGYSWHPQHSYWDDFFILRGLKDAATVAAVLGKNEAGEFAAERDDFRQDLYASLAAAMQLRNIRYIPGCVELGDFSGLSTTIAITPCGELAHIPEDALRATFDESYRQFLERRDNTIVWDAYLPYEARFVGAFTYLGQRDRANEILNYLMHDRRPPGWNHWAEVVWKDRDAPKSIGDMPHSWAASDFIRAVRSMLVYELEEGDGLVIGAGVPETWLDDPDGWEARNLPTWYGPLTIAMHREDATVVVELSGNLTLPDGGVVVRSPRNTPIRSVTGDAVVLPDSAGISIGHLPATIRISY
jgi:hypothetical protein